MAVNRASVALKNNEYTFIEKRLFPCFVPEGNCENERVEQDKSFRKESSPFYKGLLAGLKDIGLYGEGDWTAGWTTGCMGIDPYCLTYRAEQFGYH
jgi:hypothetical protein